jgi:hypothetical protein
VPSWLFAACTADGAGVTYNEHINVALAVAMPDGGLITPVIKDADTTDIYQISRNWVRYAFRRMHARVWRRACRAYTHLCGAPLVAHARTCAVPSLLCMRAHVLHCAWSCTDGSTCRLAGFPTAPLSHVAGPLDTP